MNRRDRKKSLLTTFLTIHRGCLILIGCGAFLFTLTLLGMHNSEKHNTISERTSSADCPCHALSALWDQGVGVSLAFHLVGSCFFRPPVRLIVLPRLLQYGVALQRAPPTFSN